MVDGKATLEAKMIAGKIDGTWNDVIHCLRVVLAASEPLTVECIATFTGFEHATVKKYFDNLSSFFVSRKAGDGCSVLQPFHKSVRDVLTDAYADENGPGYDEQCVPLKDSEDYDCLYVNVHAGTEALATACRNVLVTGVDRLDVERALAAAAETHEAVRYTVRHAGEHLVAVGRLKEASMLLCNVQMIELRATLESDSGGIHALLHEYFRLAVALQKARDGNADLTTRIDEYIRFVRAHRTALRDAPKQTGCHAFNFPSKTTVCLDARALKSWWETRSDWIEWTNKVEAFTPLVMSIEHPEAVRSVVYSRDESKLLSACYDGIVRLFDAKSGQEERRFEGHTGGVNSARSQVTACRLSALLVTRRCACGTPALESRCTSSRDTHVG
jgi:hypothetical protein